MTAMVAVASRAVRGPMKGSFFILHVALKSLKVAQEMYMSFSSRLDLRGVDLNFSIITWT